MKAIGARATPGSISATNSRAATPLTPSSVLRPAQRMSDVPAFAVAQGGCQFSSVDTRHQLEFTQRFSAMVTFDISSGPSTLL